MLISKIKILSENDILNMYKNSIFNDLTNNSWFICKDENNNVKIHKLNMVLNGFSSKQCDYETPSFPDFFSYSKENRIFIRHCICNFCKQMSQDFYHNDKTAQDMCQNCRYLFSYVKFYEISDKIISINEMINIIPDIKKYIMYFLVAS